MISRPAIPRLLMLALGVLAAATVACAESAPAGVPLEVTSVPWGNEEARYVLQDHKDTVGTVTRSVQLSDNAFLITQQFEPDTSARGENPVANDRLETRVRASDLKPIASERVTVGKDGELRIRAQFNDGVLAISWATASDLKSRQINVAPDVYEDGAAPLLWRALPFAEGYEAFYRSINASIVQVPEVVTVRLRVTRRETVTVPAGAFDAWRVEVHAAGRQRVAWYAVDGTHPLVKYDNGEQVFLLESLSNRATQKP